MSTVIDALQIVLYANTDGRGFFNKAAADDFTELDKRIIPLFIWTPYLSGNRSEYQEFIWSKISRKVIEDYQPFLRSMKYIISALTPEQLTYSSKKTAKQAEKIASLKQDGIHVNAD